MKTLLFALCACLLATINGLGQQTPAAPVVLQIYVQRAQEPPLLARIALGLAQPVLKISGFAKCATITNLQMHDKRDGVALQLTPEDTKVLTAILDDKTTEDPTALNGGTVWFTTPNNKILGYEGRDPLKHQLGRDGVLAIFAEDDTPLYNYLCNTLKPN